MADNQYNTFKKSISTLSWVFPENWMDLVGRWLHESPVKVSLVKPRRSKTGDFRPARPQSEPGVTLNIDLHPVEMIITLAHELAHFRIWKRYVIKRKPHGKEWKNEFRSLLKELIDSNILDAHITSAIIACYFKRERIGSGMCMALHPLLHAESQVMRVNDISEGEAFTLRGGRVFVKGPKIRSRYRCQELKSGRIFAVHPLAEVVLNLTSDVVKLERKR